MIANVTSKIFVSSQEMLLDGITPIAAYASLRRALAGPSFLLESAPGAGQLARHSIIGLGVLGDLVAAQGRLTLKTPCGKRTFEPAQALDAARLLLRECTPADIDLEQARFLGAYGIASFEFAGYFERIAPLLQHDDHAPDLHLVVPKTVIVFDHYTHKARITSLADGQAPDDLELVQRLSRAWIAPLANDAPVTELHAVSERLGYQAMVAAAKLAIVAGEVFQVVLSQRWTAAAGLDPFPVYRRLRSINPSPYMFFLELDDRALLGSSPEMLCKLDERRVRLRPLAGTRPRPALAERERVMARELRRDPKERAEHVMLVDLGRNDLGRVCEYGSVSVTELLQIERYSHVMHLVSEVQGRLAPDRDAFDLFAATFPAGTVSGAPKIRAMQLIAQLEGRRRGYYGGSVVRFGLDGSLDACIVLRSAEVRQGVASVAAGAGIVADSVAALEDAECRAKADAIGRALGAVEGQP
jgi:anthranilate synthase component I